MIWRAEFRLCPSEAPVYGQSRDHSGGHTAICQIRPLNPMFHYPLLLAPTRMSGMKGPQRPSGTRRTQVMFSSLLPAEGHVFGKERKVREGSDGWRWCWRDVSFLDCGLWYQNKGSWLGSGYTSQRLGRMYLADNSELINRVEIGLLSESGKKSPNKLQNGIVWKLPCLAWQGDTEQGQGFLVFLRKWQMAFICQSYRVERTAVELEMLRNMKDICNLLNISQLAWWSLWLE